MVTELAPDEQARPRQEEGESAWFDRAIRQYERRVLMTAYRLLGQMEDAQDAAQQVFYRLHKYRNRVARDEDLSPLLYRMTVNVCADARRKVREMPLDPAIDVASGKPGHEARLEKKDQLRALRRALDRLAEKQRAAIVLRDIEGLTTSEVAKALECSEVTVRSHISTGRLRLREWMRGMK